MSKVKYIPTSKLVYESVFPGSVEVRTKRGVDEEIFLRLTREFKLTPTEVHKFVDREKEIITSRGEDLSSYYFGNAHTLDESLRAFYSSLDYISKTLNYRENLNEFTYSELLYFRSILYFISQRYAYRQAQLTKLITSEDKRVAKVLRGFSSSAEKDDVFNLYLDYRGKLSEQKNTEKVLVGLFDLLGNGCLSKVVSQFGISRYDLNAIRIVGPEILRINSKHNFNGEVSEKLEEYRQLDNDVYTHDVDILNEFDVRGYTLKRK